jgi:hypothetical protein
MSTIYDLASVGFALDTSYQYSLSGFNVTQNDFLVIKLRNDLGIYNNSVIWPVASNASLSSAFGGIAPLQSLPTLPFSRSTSATRVNSNGLIEYVNPNVPRIDYDPVTLQSRGLLIENTRTNLFTQSTNPITVYNAGGSLGSGGTLCNWGYLLSATGVANSGIAPDGTNTAYYIVPLYGYGIKRFTKSFSSGIPQFQNITFSVFAKASGYSSFGIGFSDTANGNFVGSARFNVNPLALSCYPPTGRITNTTIQPYASGWYRASITLSGTNLAFTQVYVSLLSSMGALYGSGGTGGTGTNGVDGMYFWGPQLEVIPTSYSSDNSLYPTSYIPTGSTTATRTYDIVTLTTQNSLSSFLNQGAGTWVAEFTTPGTPPSACTVIDYNSVNGTMINLTGGFVTTYNTDTSINSTFKPLPGIDNINRTAFSYTTGGSLSGRAIAINGNVLFDTAAPFNNVAVTAVNIGGNNDGTGNINGWLGQLEYYNVSLPNSILQTLTLPSEL